MRTATTFIAVLTASNLLASSTAFAQPCATMRYGWTRTFGGDFGDNGRSIALGNNGQIYLGGFFEGLVDFDPAPDKFDWHEALGDEEDVFYSLFDADGNHQWTGTAGGIESDTCFAAESAESRIYFGGSYTGLADLDPGPGEDVRSGNPNYTNAYLSYLSVDGRYHWSRTIDSSSTGAVRSIRIDSQGNIVSAGNWGVMADFNPGNREDVRESSNCCEVFVWKLDPDGKYRWAHTFGGPDFEHAASMALDHKDAIYTAGMFSEEVDFDPRGKHDVRRVQGILWDAFLTKVSRRGKVKWTWTVGSTTQDEARGVAIGSDGRVYVTGFVTGTADFDARGRGDVRALQGGADAFVTVFKPNGHYLGTHILPGMNSAGQVVPRTLALDEPRGLMAIGGSFTGTVDLDPGSGVDARTSNGSFDCFVVLLTLEGEHVESFAFGGDDQDWLEKLVFDANGSLLLTGDFYSARVAFDPCTGGDVRTRVGSAVSDVFFSKYLCNVCN